MVYQDKEFEEARDNEDDVKEEGIVEPCKHCRIRPVENMVSKACKKCDELYDHLGEGEVYRNAEGRKKESAAERIERIKAQSLGRSKPEGKPYVNL